TLRSSIVERSRGSCEISPKRRRTARKDIPARHRKSELPASDGTVRQLVTAGVVLCGRDLLRAPIVDQLPAYRRKRATTLGITVRDAMKKIPFASGFVLTLFATIGGAEGNETAKVLTLDEVLRSEEHTSELQSRENLVCRLL